VIVAGKNNMNSPAEDNTEKYRKTAFYLSVVVMLTGLLFSRALLSLGLIFFVALSFIHRDILRQLKTFVTSPMLWSMSLLFLLPAISGFWSEDVSQWSKILRIKLPLLLLPLCFAGQNNFKFKDWQRMAFVFLAMIFAGICQSLWQYAQNTHAIHSAYLKAYTIETPLGNDHVRFSLLVVIAILTIVLLLTVSGKNFKQSTRILLLGLALINIIYLHVLAVRTGLICLYVGSFIFLIWLLSQHKRKTFFWLILVFLLPVASYFIFPTFKNKIHYLKYDFSFIQKNIYVPGSSDGNRFASIKAGWELLNEHPFFGVGFGDIKNETEKFYEGNFSQMSENDKILPSSEWMIYGTGTGWLGVVLFSVVLIIPFFVRALRKNIFWTLLNIFIGLSYLFDIGLEVQYGVFVHSFILLWWYKWLRLKE
jgi:O-antigen ligase